MPRIDWLVTELNVMGGAEMFVRRAAPLLRRSGWDLRVVTLVSGGPLVAELSADGVPVVELGVRGPQDAGVLLRLARLWQAAPPDLVHTHLYHAGLVGRLVARQVGIRRVVVHQHGAELGRGRLRTLLDRAAAGLVDNYVTSCRAVAQILNERERVPATRITIIYNGLEAAVLARPAGEQHPPGWPLPPGALALGCVGRLAVEKGQDVLLEALVRLNNTGKELHTVLIGTGAQAAVLAARAAHADLAGRVHFTGERRDIPAWLACFDLFVLPSRWEGISLALLEAMAAGLPVIATAVGGTPEVVEDGVTGLLVLPNDPRSLARAIQRLVEQPALRLSLGQAGRERVASHFNLEGSLRQLDKLYRSLLGKEHDQHAAL